MYINVKKEYSFFRAEVLGQHQLCCLCEFCLIEFEVWRERETEGDKESSYTFMKFIRSTIKRQHDKNKYLPVTLLAYLPRQCGSHTLAAETSLIS